MTAGHGSSTTGGEGGLFEIASGIGQKETGGAVTVSSGAGTKTTTGAIVVKTSNAGNAGVSGKL